MLDLTCEFSEVRPFLAARYRNLPILDLTAPTPPQLAEAVAFIGAEAASGTVYVHCRIGFSRSAAVVGAHLIASNQATSVEDAVRQLQQARPGIIVRREALRGMNQWWRRHESTAATVLVA